ncbi:MAG: hypothetical protein ACP5HS_13875 [Anaerolineae bacterium]
MLADLEARLGKLGFAETPDPLEIPVLFDRADDLLQSLEENGLSVMPERARFNTAAQQFRRKSNVFLKQVGATKLQEAREAADPTPENWWWYVDKLLTQKRQAQARRTLRTLGIAAVILALLSGLYMLFLRPDEATRLRIAYEQQAERALTEGDFTVALGALNMALSYAPEDGDLLVLKGVTLTLLGQQDEAETVFVEARQAFSGAEEFYVSRSQAWIGAGRPDLALEDAKEIVELNPNSALGYLQMGNANVTLGNLREATVDYERASELAQEAGQTELEGMARVQLANTTMMLMSATQESATPTP